MATSTDVHALEGAGEFMDTEELARFVRQTPDAVRSWRRTGVGPPYLRLPTSRTPNARRQTSPVLYRRSDVLAWLNASETESA